MRLTKAMKDSLLTIIRNKTKHPFKVQEDSITKELQEYIYKKEPVFKEYLDLYVEPPYSRYRESIKINGYYTQSIFIIAPSNAYLKSLIGQVVTYYSTEFPVRQKNPNYAMDPDFKPIYDKLEAFAKECTEYDMLMNNLAIIIRSCTTDTQLVEMYPDFVQYFNTAGITKAPATKSLPATFGLPDALSKFGLNLKIKEEKLSSLEDTIRKDIEDAEEEESKGTK